MANPSLCVDSLETVRESPLGLYGCRKDLVKPGFRQMFKLRNHRDISVELSNNDCLDVSNNKIIYYMCKFEQDNQYFRYDLQTQQIFCGSKRKNRCMDFDLKTKFLICSACDARKATQKWRWGFVNETMLNDWVNFGKPILDAHEVSDLISEKNIEIVKALN